ncbi:sensor histidine kinase [Paenibacillus swuensis]|nr:histidine kinase [Paenibacillus swuensis]
MITLTSLLVYILYYGIGILTTQALDSHRQLTNTYMERMDSALTKTNSFLSHLAAYDSDLSSIGAYPYGSTEYIMSKINIQKEFTTNTGLYDGVAAFFLYIEPTNDLLLSEGSSVIKPDTLRRAISSTQAKERNIYIDEKSQAIIQITSISRGVYIGAWIDPNRYSFSYDGFLFMFSDGGTSLLRKDYNSLYSNLTPALASRDVTVSNELQHDEKSYLLVKSTSTLANLQLAILIPESDLLGSLRMIKNLMWLLPIAFVVIILLFYFYLQKSFMKPVQHLHQSFKNVTAGKREVDIPEHHHDEFSFLFQSFQNMVGEINELKIDVYEEQIRAQQAEYKHLQLQINPHFYMNTLNIIYNMAAVREYQSVQKLTLHLAHYFRFITKTNRPLISLGDEMDQVRNYLDIQCMRFVDRLHYEIVMPDDIKAYPIPPVTLLTFVENTMIHGFRNKRKDLMVRVVVEPDQSHPDQLFTITIKDNGCGFPQSILDGAPATLPLSQWSPAESDERERGIGMYNVVRRIGMMPGGALARLELTNDEITSGAVVKLTLPKAI